MVRRNTYTAGTAFGASALNSQKHANANEGVTSDVSVTTGTNSFEVDVGASDYVVAGDQYSASSDTVTHDSPDSNDRVDLITVDTSGSVSITKGDHTKTTTSDGTSQPVDPDIPADQVLLAAVYIRSGASEIKTGDIYEGYQTTVEPAPPQQVLWNRVGVGDDFADNNLTGRDSPKTTTSGLSNVANVFRPVWDVDENSNITVQATGGRFQVSVPGNNDGDTAGARLPLARRERTRVTFVDTSYTDNDSDLYAGLTDVIDLGPNSALANGNGIFWQEDSSGDDSLEVVDSGTLSSTSITNIDWSSNHKVELLFRDQDTAELVVDGTTEATDSSNPVIADYGPFVQMLDLGTSTDTIEADAVEVTHR